MIRTQLTIINKLGLHARAAAKFVACTTAFSSRIQTGKSGQLVDGKSIMSVMMLAAGMGSEVELEVEGPDEQAAARAIVGLVNEKFGEGQ